MNFSSEAFAWTAITLLTVSLAAPNPFQLQHYFKVLVAPHLLGEERETKISVYSPVSSGFTTS